LNTNQNHSLQRNVKRSYTSNHSCPFKNWSWNLGSTEVNSSSSNLH